MTLTVSWEFYNYSFLAHHDEPFGHANISATVFTLIIAIVLHTLLLLLLLVLQLSTSYKY